MTADCASLKEGRKEINFLKVSCGRGQSAGRASGSQTRMGPGVRLAQRKYGTAATAAAVPAAAVPAVTVPAGWTAFLSGATPPPAWATTTAAGFFVSAPNGVATGSAATVSESRLTSATLAVPPGLSARLSFQNFYNLESGFDGGVLEISIGGGAFQDILAANPTIAVDISTLLSERRDALTHAQDDLTAPLPTPGAGELKNDILGRIRAYFGL